LLTSDGGTTWRAGLLTDPAGLYLSSIAFFTSTPKTSVKHIRAAGITGLYHTSLAEPAAWTRDSTENLNTVVYDRRGSWAVGAKGTVLRETVF
jgi:hypothetical protein